MEIKDYKEYVCLHIYQRRIDKEDNQKNNKKLKENK